jgi:uncharacterized protein YcfJ
MAGMLGAAFEGVEIMKTSVVSLLSSATLLALAGASPAAWAQAQNGGPEMGRVLSSVPVIQQVAVPRQVCTNEQVMVPGQKSGAGALMGGVAGGAMGNAIGGGSGRAAATVLGVVGGAILGDRIEGGGQPQAQTVQRCYTQTTYENQTVGYNVTYEYAGQQYTVQMPQNPGPWVRLQVTPVAPNQPYVQPYNSPYPPQPVQPMSYVAPAVITSETTYIVPGAAYARPRPIWYQPPTANIRVDLTPDRDGHGHRHPNDRRDGRFDRDGRDWR